MKLLTVLLALPLLAAAHPVSQGALDIELEANQIRVRARVPLEEILIANAFSDQGSTSLQLAIRDHGAYFNRHFRIAADGRDLPGILRTGSEAGENSVLYELEYRLKSRPKTLILTQNLLNEFLYAPGNPWEASFLVRVFKHGRLAQEGLLRAKAGFEISSRQQTQARGELFQDFFGHGIRHILSGYDHLLFITALALSALTFIDLIKIVTVFSLAHCITLTLSVLDVVRLPSAIVEVMIAVSIVVVAVGNLLWPRPTQNRMRLAAAFFFGLFHGLGFAGGLLEAMDEMTGHTLTVAIVAFSLGVEIGHQLVVLPLFAGLKRARSMRKDPAQRERLSLSMLRKGSLLISVAGGYYLYIALSNGAS